MNGERTFWSDFHERNQDKGPRPLLVEAIKYVANKDEALDLGAGHLGDSQFLISQGFNHVTAVDKEPSVKERAENLSEEKLETHIISFQEFEFPIEKYDLINAQFSLPMISKEKFTSVFEKIKGSLKGNGILTGQFFGPRDSWNTETSNLAFHSMEEINELLKDLEIIEIKEKEYDGKVMLAGVRHWHIYNVIAKKTLS